MIAFHFRCLSGTEAERPFVLSCLVMFTRPRGLHSSVIHLSQSVERALCTCTLRTEIHWVRCASPRNQVFLSLTHDTIAGSECNVVNVVPPSTNYRTTSIVVPPYCLYNGMKRNDLRRFQQWDIRLPVTNSPPISGTFFARDPAPAVPVSGSLCHCYKGVSNVALRLE